MYYTGGKNLNRGIIQSHVHTCPPSPFPSSFLTRKSPPFHCHGWSGVGTRDARGKKKPAAKIPLLQLSPLFLLPRKRRGRGGEPKKLFCTGQNFSFQRRKSSCRGALPTECIDKHLLQGVFSLMKRCFFHCFPKQFEMLAKQVRFLANVFQF